MQVTYFFNEVRIFSKSGKSKNSVWYYRYDNVTTVPQKYKRL